jgi:hypothetical protein
MQNHHCCLDADFPTLRAFISYELIDGDLHPNTIRHGTSCASKCIVKAKRGERKPCKTHDSEKVKTRNHCKPQGDMQLQVCTMPYRMAPCLLGWTCGFCTVQGWSHHGLAMTWERRASVVYLFCGMLGDFPSKFEVDMHV